MRLAQGHQLGPYEILALLGAGGMGEVYRARDTRLGRDVAIKVLHGGTIDDERRRRFEREARTIAQVEHPNLLVIFDIGTERGTDYLVTELLRGETLRARVVRDGRLPAPEVARIGEAITRGLAAAHARGIVHRDLKPENVFLTDDGRVKILDFGLAHVVTGAGWLGDAPTVEQTAPGMVLGTAPYMAPEQARGEPVDGAADLFALGAILHECLSGVSPFRRDTIGATLAAVLGDAPPALPGVRTDLAQLVERCLAKRAADRPSPASAVAEAFARVQTEPSSGATAAAPPTPASVAVLPFADLSPARDQEYFCDGIAEEILHTLTRLGGIRMAARGASFAYRGAGHDVRAVARALDVDHVLEGSVRRAGNRVRITVALVDAASAGPVWTERYDRDADDVFAIQDEIASSVASCLSIATSEDARRAWRRRCTHDLAAYEAYLRGRQYAAVQGSAIRDAIDAYERAVALDPSFAAAWAALADAHAFAFTWLGRARADAARADAASARALELDPLSAETHSARGQALAIAGREDEAAAAFERALADAPNLYDALNGYARLRYAQGRWVEAAELFERVARAHPHDYQSVALAVNCYQALGARDRLLDAAHRTVARVERRLAIVPGDARAHYLGSGALLHLGRSDQALAWTRRARELDPSGVATLYNVACGLAMLGHRDEALDTLEQAVSVGFGHRSWFEQDPDLAAIRDEPRFAALLERMPQG